MKNLANSICEWPWLRIVSITAMMAGVCAASYFGYNQRVVKAYEEKQTDSLKVADSVTVLLTDTVKRVEVEKNREINALVSTLVPVHAKAARIRRVVKNDTVEVLVVPIKKIPVDTVKKDTIK